MLDVAAFRALVTVIIRSVVHRRRMLAVGFVGFVAVVLSVFGVTAASAHATLETVAPANESVLAAMPTEVALRFDEPVALDLGCRDPGVRSKRTAG